MRCWIRGPVPAGGRGSGGDRAGALYRRGGCAPAKARFGVVLYVWSALIFALGFANLFVALALGPKIWAWYTSIVPLSAQLGLFLVQYTSLRIMVRRNIRAR